MAVRKNEIEIVHHSSMNQLEIFLVEMTTRSPHGHDDLEIGLVLEGEIILYIEKEPYTLQAGDIYVINRFQIHSFFGNGTSNKILAFQLRPELYQRINPCLSFLHFDENILRSSELRRQMRELLMACSREYFSETLAGEVACTGHLLLTVDLLLRHSQYTISSEDGSASDCANAARLNRMVNYISAHYNERISLDDLAELEHISPYHASHFLKRMLGISFQQYLNQTRFEHALDLFEKTDLSATDVSLTVGFSSTRYLNQMFALQFGCSCKEYLRGRKRQRPKYVALPSDNIQRRFSFEESRKLLNA